MATNDLLKSGDISEQAMQKAILKWVRLHPKIRGLVIHFANEGKRTIYNGKLLKDMGLRPGVSDLFIAMQKKGFGGAWIEIKTKKGILSQEQKLFLEDMEAQGYFTIVCRTIEDTIKIIEWYCFDKYQI